MCFQQQKQSMQLVNYKSILFHCYYYKNSHLFLFGLGKPFKSRLPLFGHVPLSHHTLLCHHFCPTFCCTGSQTAPQHHLHSGNWAAFGPHYTAGFPGACQHLLAASDRIFQWVSLVWIQSECSLTNGSTADRDSRVSLCKGNFFVGMLQM